MAQTYTLDEAAKRIGVPLDEFKRRIKDDWKTLRSFRDGSTLRFRSSDIDELARSLGEASDPGLQLGAQRVVRLEGRRGLCEIRTQLVHRRWCAF